MNGIWPMRFVVTVISLTPAPDGIHRNIQLFRQFTVGFVRALNIFAGTRRRGGIGVELNLHQTSSGIRLSKALIIKATLRAKRANRQIIEK
jgi:hypothetical protein